MFHVRIFNCWEWRTTIFKRSLGWQQRKEWKEALDAEYSSLVSNETWELVPPPKDANIVRSKWVLKVKRDADGNINRYKARLVTQEYSDTRSRLWGSFLSCCQILKYQNIASLGKCIWFRSSSNGCQYSFPEWNSRPWHLHASAWRIYWSRSSWLCVQAKEEQVWPQAVSYMLESNTRQFLGDKWLSEKPLISFVILAVYVDDIIPVSNDVKMLKAEKESLCREFEKVDLGEINFILGMSSKRDRATRTLTISQGQYVKDLLKRFGMEECKPCPCIRMQGYCWCSESYRRHSQKWRSGPGSWKVD